MTKITVITSLYRCSKYLPSYLEHVKKIRNPEEVEVLLLHNAPTQEELDVINEGIKDIPFIRHIIIPEREGLYATWNRGVKLAQGEYCAIWNVDDIRTPDSLLLQAKTLDENQEAVIVYGNHILSAKYGDTSGRMVNQVDYKLYPKEALKRHIIGCFPMWRKKIHETIGYFDEQFKLVADYEFQIRTVHNYPIVKVEALLGYFLLGYGNEGRLSQQSKLQIREHTAVGLRYGIYNQLNLMFYFSANKMIDLYNVYSFGMKNPISSFIQGYGKIKKRHLGLHKAILRLPINFMREFYHLFK